ncbi:RNA polymerase sigma-70 factor (ECF subfamily) [Haloferula luteola]|uniref:RNA polymerase sigma-70 factor (ECF subfamily) n=1 Tax=Haloferula luteola TaxID=595692 RepID=A0A840VF62_9BACT|nr:sigma-70 family RNA polymerase sigma factor [Haloferula luteola]MBB5352459.1 RNA polymerase sigma-70 factor (ECF subfamily) [Haloferula luteola]
MDRARFSELIRGHHRGLLAYATALVKSDAAARDLVQDACVAAWQSLGRFDATRDFGIWMRGIIRNKWREYCRRHAREVALDEETLERLEAPFRSVSGDGELFDRLEECRGKLPSPMADAVRLTYDEGRSSEEAAALLSTSAAALRKRLERAREALRECLSRLA